MSAPITLHEIADASAHGVASFSPFCLKVNLALTALGLPFTRAHGPFPGHWKKLNPTGQVPVAVIDGDVIADSTAIVRRLRAVSKGGLNDGFTAREEAEALLLEELADSDINGFIVAARWLDDDNWQRTKKAFFGNAPPPVAAVVSRLARRQTRERLIARDVWRRGPEACWQRLETMLDALEARAPSTGFWFNDRLSTGDIALAAQLRSLMTPLTPAQAAAVQKRPTLMAWIARVLTAATTTTTTTTTATT